VDRIGVVGASYRTTQLESLGQAGLPSDFPEESLVELARLVGVAELVYLKTCNRVEFYFRTDGHAHSKNLLFHLRRSLTDLTDGTTELPPDDELFFLRGQEAARHLFRVCAALDSMMVGEAQIAGQAKEAHETAHRLGLLGGFLDQCFHEAFHLAKRIKNETELSRRPVSLVTLVERTLNDHLAASSAPVLLIGAGAMAAQSLRLVRSADPERRVVVANRSPERALALVQGDPAAGTLSLDAVQLDPPRVGTVIAAVTVDEPVLTREAVSAIRTHLPIDERLLVVDLGLPPNVDPSAATEAGVVLHGIEAMREEAERNRRLRLEETDRCEALVDHQLTILRRRFLDRELSPVARSLHSAFREVAERTVRHALGKDLSQLDEDERRALERLTEDMVKRLVQVPLRGLKAAAWAHTSAVVDGFLEGLADDGRGAREPSGGGP